MKHSRLLGSIGLVSGTSIGAAMLALPISAGLSGFFPSLIVIFLVWLSLMASAFFLLEIEMKFPRGSNLITMAQKALGPMGKLTCAVTYILLLYSLISAYLAGGSGMVYATAQNALGLDVPFWCSTVGFAALFGAFIYFGTASVDWLNRLLMTALILSYLWLVVRSSGYVDASRVFKTEWNLIWVCVPVIITSFGFHIVIPTLSDYLDRDVALLKKVLWIGGSIPLVIYIVWNFLVIGMLPYEGLASITSAFKAGLMPQEVLERSKGAYLISTIASFFGFFAIITSFLGVAMSLLDFIADGLKIKKDRIGRFVLCLLVFTPPVIFVISQARGFYIALRFGGLFVSVLLGILPCLMVLAMRKKKIKSPFKTPGGSALVWGVFSMFCVGIAICLADALVSF